MSAGRRPMKNWPHATKIAYAAQQTLETDYTRPIKQSEFMWVLMLKKYLWVLGLTIFLTAETQARSFGADWDESDWSINAGPFACSLVQKVPGFGQVSLSRKAGGDESLELQQQGKEGFPAGSIRVQAIPPSWRQDLASVNMGVFNQGVARAPLQFNTSQVLSLLGQLEQGMQLVFSAVEERDAQVFRVFVSPRNFGPAYKRYRNCVSQLIPYSFQQMARITLYYQKDAAELSATSKNQLDKVARYSQADKQVLGVIVDAHSDARDSAEQSQAASELQANLVTQYLVGKGLPMDIITSRWHGDKYPAASNGDEQGRAKNRRVTLRLENTDTRIAREKKIAEHKKSVGAQKASSESATTENNPSGTTGLTLKELERMVENQDLTSGKQPKSSESAKKQ